MARPVPVLMQYEDLRGNLWELEGIGRDVQKVQLLQPGVPLEGAADTAEIALGELRQTEWDRVEAALERVSGDQEERLQPAADGRRSSRVPM